MDRLKGWWGKEGAWRGISGVRRDERSKASGQVGRTDVLICATK
jgi:hypothetical protein